MPAATATHERNMVHQTLPCGAELGVESLPGRRTVTLALRFLGGLALEAPEHTGACSLVESLLSKGTERYDGRGIANAFDHMGGNLSTATGRQTSLLRVLCLPEALSEAIDLLAELIRRPTFPEDACRVAVDLARQDLTHLEDEPQALLRRHTQRLTLGDQWGRDPDGEADSLPQLTRDVLVDHWRKMYQTGRMQVAAAGPIDAERLTDALDAAFSGLGSADRAGRDIVTRDIAPRRLHVPKDLKQQYIAMTLPGLPRDDEQFAVEKVMLSVLSGGMSGRLFTEVREKQGLVYWVGAWHEQMRGCGVIHLGASTTPERCDQTFDTLLRELKRLGRDVTDDEVERSQNQLIAHRETEDDLTRARAAAISDDLFHFGHPRPLAAQIAAIKRVTRAQVLERARSLPLDQLCVATLGPRELAVRA